eukprot:1752109-Pleurochrysis_carterae.AAC.2
MRQCVTIAENIINTDCVYSMPTMDSDHSGKIDETQCVDLDVDWKHEKRQDQEREDDYEEQDPDRSVIDAHDYEEYDETYDDINARLLKQLHSKDGRLGIEKSARDDDSKDSGDDYESDEASVSNDDEGEGEDADAHEKEWLSSTVYCTSIDDVVTEEYTKAFLKYIDRPVNRKRVLREVRDSAIHLNAMKKQTKTLTDLLDLLDTCIDDVLESYITRYRFFDVVKTKDDYSLYEIEKGGQYTDHIECTPLETEEEEEATEQTPHRMCIYVVIDAPKEGGELSFMYQGISIRPEVGMVIAFPACPLHPVRVERVKKGRLVYAVCRVF